MESARLLFARQNAVPFGRERIINNVRAMPLLDIETPLRHAIETAPQFYTLGVDRIVEAWQAAARRLIENPDEEIPTL